MTHDQSIFRHLGASPAVTSVLVAAAAFFHCASGVSPTTIDGVARVSAIASAATCDETTSYVNSSGNCDHRPEVAGTVPAGATAQCRDGEYSFSQHREGTCSGHQGVSRWLVSLPG